MNDREIKPHNWPVHVIKEGAVEAAIWERTDPKTGTPQHQVTMSRSYRTKDGTWARTSTFDTWQLSEVAKVTEKSQSWILERTRELAKDRAQTRSRAPVQEKEQAPSPNEQKPARDDDETRRLLKQLIRTLSRTNEPGNAP